MKRGYLGNKGGNNAIPIVVGPPHGASQAAQAASAAQYAGNIKILRMDETD